MNTFHKSTNAWERLRMRNKIAGSCMMIALVASGIGMLMNPPNPRPFLKVACAHKLGPEMNLDMEKEITARGAKITLSNVPNDCIVQRCETGKVTTCRTATEKDIATIENDVKEYEKDHSTKRNIEQRVAVGILITMILVFTAINWKYGREKKQEDKEMRRRMNEECAKAREILKRGFGAEEPKNDITS
jgi:hypothetical protein